MLDVGIVCEEVVIFSGAGSALSPVFCVSTSDFWLCGKAEETEEYFHIFFWHVTGESVSGQQPVADVRPWPKEAVTFQPERFCDSS